MSVQALSEATPRLHCPGVVAVIPAHNEERFIASVVITALQYVERVIVVDDGSTDRTALLAGIAGAEVVELGENQGYGFALSTGFERAKELDAKVIVMLDGDAQHDPAEIPRVTRPILDGEADVVIGSRFLEVKSDIPRWRRMGQHALTYVTNKGSGLSTTDSQSGFRAFSRSALQRLRFTNTGMGLASEMLFLVNDASLQVKEVPIAVQYLDGNKRNPVMHGLQVLDGIVSLVARRRPLLLLGSPGLFLMIAGFILGLAVVEAINVRHVVPLGTSVLSSLLMLMGLLLCITGLILNTLEHFMARIREEIADLGTRPRVGS